MPDDSMEKIEKMLDEKIRPVLRADNGDVEVLSFVGGVLKLKSLGGCGNCPSAVFEIEQMVVSEARTAVPDLNAVVVVTGVSGELLETARALMEQHRKNRRSVAFA